MTMNIKKKHIVLTCVLIMVMALIAAVCIFLYPPQRKGEKALSYLNKRVMTYDENGNLVKDELLFSETDEPAEVLKYRYDDDGNRTAWEAYAYGEADFESSYEYDEAGRMTVRSKGVWRLQVTHQENGVFVEAKGRGGTAEDVFYKVEDGKVQSATRDWSGPNADPYLGCSYDEEGRLKVFNLDDGRSGSVQRNFTYVYDKSGRYERIICLLREQESAAEWPYYNAEFVYRPFSKNYTVYVYDRVDKLVGKYEFIYGKNGKLSEVQLYVRDKDGGVIWGTGYERSEYDYPGGEVPESFFYY